MKCILEGQLPAAEQIGTYSKEQIDISLLNKVNLDFSNAEKVDSTLNNINAANRQLSNLDTTQAALAALGAGVRPNLLDNPYFSSLNAPGLPINQNTATTWAGDYSITIDRWRKVNVGTVSISEAGIYVPVGEILYQYINPNFLNYLFGKTVTASILLSDGRLFTGTGEFKNQAEINPLLQDTDVNIYTLSSGGFQVAFGNNSFVSTSPQTYVAAKLEIGDKQTLAYKDGNGDWKLLPQPDSSYGSQLLECQRYYSKSSQNINGFSGGFLATVQPESTEWLNLSARFPVAMVKTPTISVTWLSKATNISQQLISGGVIFQPNAVSESGFNLLKVQGLTLESGAVYLVQFSADASL